TIPPLHGYILVAEDNRVNQKVVSEMLSLMGCTCHIVENGKEAIEALKREDFDLILMDAQMPVMDGYEATRLIRRGDAGSANKIIPILATTANAIKGDIEACLEAGMNDYISKPIAYNDLAIKIEKWMARGQNVIDDTNLQKLREQGEKSGKEFISELVEIFKQDAPEAVAVMRSNLNAKLIKEIPPIAHNLKTSAGILGALRLKELAERIERSKMDSVTEQQLALLIDSLDNELRLVLEHLDNQLKKDAPRRSSPDAQL
ncbi:MAG: response regulator, partial [Bdellovibrio sp.]|nr:response regulator [Bdellovibrio sp.]